MKGFDFRRRPARRLHGGWLLSALALAGLLASGAMWRQLEDEADQLQQAPIATPARPAVSASSAALQAQAYATALLGLPWAALFADLEAALDERSAVLELEPDAEAGRLRIVAEAPDLAAMLAFIERLQSAASLDEIQLASHRLLLPEPGQPVRFILRARWCGVGAASVSTDTALHTPAG